ncbi:MAG: hypothetical protein RL077_447 [Verrucomicrobiota bacterium]|jgi:hypothetical protein
MSAPQRLGVTPSADLLLPVAPAGAALASYADVARKGGHNEIVLRRYYERRVTAREAREYFALPSRV